MYPLFPPDRVEKQRVSPRQTGCCVPQLASRHSRESGNPGDERHGDWMPAAACPRESGGGHDVLQAPDLRNKHLVRMGRVVMATLALLRRRYPRGIELESTTHHDAISWE